MSKKSLPPIVYIAGVLAAGAGYFAFKSFTTSVVGNNPSIPIEGTSGQQSAEITSAFEIPAALPGGTTIKIGGATSMVQINRALKTAFEKKFSGVQAVTVASSSDKGLIDLAAGNIDIAGISRELTEAEKSQGLVAVTVAKDKIAIVIGNDNALRTGLTADQVAKIFTGEIKNWSEVGGKSLAIRPVLRPANSGTHQSFQAIGLQGKSFGSGGDFKVLDRDATTPLLQALGADGIGYATFAQVANQSTVRFVAIDGTTPEAGNYPYQRSLSYVYKNPPSDAVKAFLGFATSADGQTAIAK
jgi:phosphate transport system substrate-binding protein